MSEIVGWTMTLGLAFAIGCIFMLSSQIEQHSRETATAIFQSNEMLLARFERAMHPSAQAPEPLVGVVLERRRAQRSDASPRPAAAGSGGSQRGHLLDLLSA